MVHPTIPTHSVLQKTLPFAECTVSDYTFLSYACSEQRKACISIAFVAHWQVPERAESGGPQGASTLHGTWPFVNVPSISQHQLCTRGAATGSKDDTIWSMKHRETPEFNS